MFFFVHSPGPQPPGSTSMKQHHDGSHSRPGHQGTQAASPTSTGPVPITLIPPLCPLTNSPTHRHTAGNSNPGFAVETQGREAPGQCWGDCRKDCRKTVERKRGRQWLAEVVLDLRSLWNEYGGTDRELQAMGSSN